MPRGDKSKYTDKQKRQAEHIEESYEQRGASEEEAERRAWATVNKQDGGGKRGGSGAKRSAAKKSSSGSSKRAAKGGAKKSGAKKSASKSSSGAGSKRAGSARKSSSGRKSSAKSSAKSLRQVLRQVLNHARCGQRARDAPAARRYARHARRSECLPQASLHIPRPVARNAGRQPACRARAPACAAADDRSR